MNGHLRAMLCLAWIAGQASPSAVAGNRLVRVVTVSQDGLDRSRADLFDATMELLNRAASFRPDIAALPEVFLPGSSETVPGPVTKRLSEWARQNSSYVVAGIRTMSGGKQFNSAILIDRKGGVAGQYDKMYPTESELRDGIHPGQSEPPVFETDFGKIGVQICFDVNWWENWAKLAAKGVRIVFFPAAYPAARQLSALALMNQFFVVSSTQSRLSRIYDITGEELAVSGRFQPWAGSVLPVGRRLFEIDFHTRKVRELLAKYGSRVEVKWYHEDDWFTLASLDPNVTTEDLIAEFGLTPLNAYRSRASDAVRKVRSSSAPPELPK